MGSFGKFQLLEQIGGGRLSEVFRVARRNRQRGPNIALKRVIPALIGEEAFATLVVREASLLTRLHHESLCTCHEMGVVDGCAFLTLELVDGCTLRALMRRMSQLGVSLPASALLGIGQQLATVLEYLHSRGADGIVHLDLSPQNVLLSRDGRVKLIDFGIARYLDGHDPPPLAGKIAGTIGYMSPEQAAGAHAIDERADQSGLGILLWELCYGQRLFRGNTAETWKRMRGGVLPVTTPPADRAPAMLALIRRLLAVDPQRRFSGIGEPKQRLAALARSPTEGEQTLAALVRRLLAQPDFDPFDKINLRRARARHTAADVPTGEVPIAGEYEALEIRVDLGPGTIAAQLREAIPEIGDGPPSSPFLKVIAEPNVD